MPLLQGRSSSPNACDGDLIIVQEKYNALTPVVLRAGSFLNNRYGRFAHDDVIGHPLGRRWEAKSHPGTGSGTQACAGFVHALKPTPELWSLAMFHRTQIVYPHDSAVITLFLDLRPGQVLIESGTGSGSASVAFARAVAPLGQVRSFEFHKPRADAAQKDFRALGLEHVVKVTGGVDVVKQGFLGVNDGEADAVFLDLPAPYLMGEEVARVLKPNGTVCTFSPCLEQVQKSAEMFRKGPFHSVRTVTAPVRTYETREQILGTPGFDELQESQKDVANPALNDESSRHRKRQRIELSGSTRRKLKTAGAERLEMADKNDGRHDGRVIRVAARLHSRPFSSMKGHTSYLTFARRKRGNVKASPNNGAGPKLLLGDAKSGADGSGISRRESCIIS
ncbi:unnamed protein product [Chondrus crispus]|uniref:tRNA (adenine(58)-N(1))-methyltransferase n=1 Tax=Chondrus crispus TaxID=2769 RepID=R7QRE0_CHOCR|nr:unnamed protein product [Chondrus crispus]CDF41047.1 unnamed protein product [Chondrus crispus]|eukprot:XP_005711341.1 unnamed protein product [Chondrus crispus]